MVDPSLLVDPVFGDDLDELDLDAIQASAQTEDDNVYALPIP